MSLSDLEVMLTCNPILGWEVSIIQSHGIQIEYISDNISNSLLFNILRCHGSAQKYDGHEKQIITDVKKINCW